MATNIEIKARIQDLEKLKGLVEQLSDGPAVSIPQEDTFFPTPRGRLKLRCLSPEHGELIYYEREDASGPKPSNYLVHTTHDPDSLKAALSAALGVRGVLRKQRWLYLVGQTRVHLDEVEDLGAFLELEVVLGTNQSQAEGVVIAHKLMAQLGIEETDLIEAAYIDLIAPTFKVRTPSHD